jgi:GTP cyclohydrolase II
MHVFRTTVPSASQGFQEHVALVYGTTEGVAGLPVRVHSECLTGEVFGSLKCDCRDQLDLALSEIVRLGAGSCCICARKGGASVWPTR